MRLKMIERIKNVFSAESKDVFKDTIAVSLIIGIIAHAYIYINSVYGHDSLSVAFDRVYQSASGTRWFQDVLYNLTNFTNAPWLAGLICMLILSVSSYEIVDLFKVKRYISIFLISGIVITNPTVIASNLYEFPFVFFFAIIFMITAIWIVERTDYLSMTTMLISVSFIALSLGTYAGYIAVYPTLVCLIVIRDIIGGKPFAENIKKIGVNVGLFVSGVALYYVIERLCLKFQKLEIPYYGTRDSLTAFVGIKAYVYGWYRGYIDFFNYVLGRTERFQYVPTVLTILLLAIGFVILAYYFIQIKGIANKILLAGIVIMLPLFVNFSYLATAGMLHYLFYFSFALVFVFCVVLSEKMLSSDFAFKCSLSGLAIVIAALFVWHGFVLSNSAYSKAENMYVRTVSICTRLLDDIEDVYTGDEEVILIGTIDMNDVFFNTEYSNVTNILGGLGHVDPNYNNMFAFGHKEKQFLQNIMGSSLEYYYCEDKKECVDTYISSSAFKSVVQEMPQYPCKGSVINVGEYIIVNLQ